LEANKNIAIDRIADSLSIHDEIPEKDLPSLDVLEDVFKTLGVWDKAVTLHNKGLTWSQVASKLISDCEK